MSGALVAMAFATLSSACSREADIADEPEAGVEHPPIPRPDGPLTLIEDAGLDSDAHPSCRGRPTAACEGVNDFVCAFDTWITTLTGECFRRTDCDVNGWVEVTLGDDGCASELRMEAPDTEFADCVLAELATTRCPCGAVSTAVFMGLANSGCAIGLGGASGKEF